jgi:uncharacterized membrane protein
MTPAFFAQAATDHAASAFLGFGFFFLILAALYVVLWLYCIINAATRTDFDTTQRLIWILVLLFLHGLGPILYLILAGRKLS